METFPKSEDKEGYCEAFQGGGLFDMWWWHCCDFDTIPWGGADLHSQIQLSFSI